MAAKALRFELVYNGPEFQRFFYALYKGAELNGNSN
jgi:hypothetical protein